MHSSVLLPPPTVTDDSQLCRGASSGTVQTVQRVSNCNSCVDHFPVYPIINMPFFFINISFPLSPFLYAFFSLSLHSLFHSQFHTLVKGKRIPWRLADRILQSIGKEGVIEAQVLAEELAYNKTLQQYRMFIVDRPMVHGLHRQQSKDSKEDLLAVRRTHSGHYKLLQCFENHRQVC